MSAPGRFYVFDPGKPDQRVYEVKPETYWLMEDSGGFFRVAERCVYAPNYPLVVGDEWRVELTRKAYVLGWYDTLEEAIFALEVLL